MKVLIEDKTGNLIWHNNITSIVEYDHFIILCDNKRLSDRKILKNNISSIEVIPTC